MLTTYDKWSNIHLHTYYEQCGLLAYLIRDWRTLHYVTSALILPQLLLWWIIPESPRWLITQKKWKTLAKILDKMERMNRKKIPVNVQVKNSDLECVRVEDFEEVLFCTILEFKTYIEPINRNYGATAYQLGNASSRTITEVKQH